MRRLVGAGILVSLYLTECLGGGGVAAFQFPEPRQSDMDAVYSDTVLDAADDFEIASGGAPVYLIHYPPVDVISLATVLEYGQTPMVYAILRFKIFELSAYFPRDKTIEFGGRSEAESDLYHHNAFDPWTADFFCVPAAEI